MEEVFNLVNQMSPYLLLGFLFAGILHAFVPGTVYSRYLSGHNFRSVIYASLFGVPLPLCSCGVIPTAMSLRKEGASKGATVSFLIATPETGVDSIAATYSLMGLPFAIFRPITAFLTSILAGSLVNAFDKDEVVKHSKEHNHRNESNVKEPEGNSSLPTPHSSLKKVREALHYGFVEMLGDIGKWLFIGLVIAGLITVFVPDSFFETFKGNTFLSMLLVLCIAIPMYICATGSIPIAVALIMKGLTPGAALVLLMAGPACNMASILVINKVLGRKTLVLYLISIITGAIVAGTIIDRLPGEWFIPTMMAGAHHAANSTPWPNYLCTLILCLLFINVLWQRYHHGHTCSCGHDHGHDHSHSHCCEHTHTEQLPDNQEVSIPFHIKGLNCSHCCSNAEKALKALPRVTDATVDLATGKATVTGDTTPEAITEALGSLGFTAVF